MKGEESLINTLDTVVHSHMGATNFQFTYNIAQLLTTSLQKIHTNKISSKKKVFQISYHKLFRWFSRYPNMGHAPQQKIDDTNWYIGESFAETFVKRSSFCAKQTNSLKLFEITNPKWIRYITPGDILLKRQLIFDNMFFKLVV